MMELALTAIVEVYFGKKPPCFAGDILPFEENKLPQNTEEAK